MCNLTFLECLLAEYYDHDYASIGHIFCSIEYLCNLTFLECLLAEYYDHDYA